MTKAKQSGDVIAETDYYMLEKLWETVEALLHSSHVDTFDTVGSYEGDRWSSGCYCEQCLTTVERLDMAQAELEVGYRTVAIEGGIEDHGEDEPAWRRVKGWFEAWQRQQSGAYSGKL